MDSLGLVKCTVSVYLTHGAPDEKGPFDPIPKPPVKMDPCEKWGFFGCHADRYNGPIEPPNKIDFPSVPPDETWPGGKSDCDAVNDLLQVGKAIREARDELCDNGCCKKVTMNIQFDLGDSGKAFSKNVQYARKLIENGKCKGNVDDLPQKPQNPFYTCPKKK